MKLAKVTCELKYSERVKLLSGYEAVYLDVLKKAPDRPDQWIIPGLRIEDKEKKRVMVIDPVRSVVDIEEPPNAGFCRDLIMQFFKSIDDRVGIPKIARYGLRSTWLEEYKGSFEDLLKKFKQRIYGNSSLTEKANDVGAIFDYYSDGGRKLSVTTGPMKIEQLKSQFLVFEPTSSPLLFLYVDVDVGDTTIKQFSAQSLHSFFDEAVKEGERLATEVITNVGVGQ